MGSPAVHVSASGLAPRAAARGVRDGIERWLEAERDQVPLWLPVAFGIGILAWFALPDAQRWSGWLLGTGAAALLGVALSGGGRFGRVLAVGAALTLLGCAATWWRAERVEAPVLARPAVAMVEGRVAGIERLAARALVRLTIEVAPASIGLPPRVRVNLAQTDVPPGLTRGAAIRVRARLMPPAGAAVPGGYDYARVAWFSGIGATGRGFAPVTVLRAGEAEGADLRARLAAHIGARVPGSAGGIAAALATGDRGAIAQADTQAMQRSGLAHLLSVSGLHVTAVTAAAMLAVLRLLALSPWLALRVRLPLVAAGAGALAAIGYTWLTGAEVPTLRSCAAALLVLLALALGREALTLRLVAAGALLVLLLWPESLVGPSFQLSFAAVTTIVALHENRRVRGWFSAREEGRGRALLRGAGSLLFTGLAVELALMPIALFHFHQSGLYGALANIVAIPLTTFVVMPLEASALALDLIGLGAPLWWVVALALQLLLAIAHVTASAPGAVAALPSMPGGAYALMAGGGLWLALWRTRVRMAGLLPLAAGALWALLTPAPDMLATGDGRHVALRMADGRLALLRERTGDFTRAMLRENAGSEEEALMALDDRAEARCSPDLCIADVMGAPRGFSGEQRRLRVLATRSAYPIPYDALVAACASADIVVSDRRLPRACRPRWLRLDRAMLARTGGVALSLASGAVRTVRQPGDRHPWIDPPRVQPPRAAQ